MKKERKILLILTFLSWLLIQQSCGEDSLLDCEKNKPAKCEELSEDEQIILDLNERKYAVVIEKLEKLVTEFPNEYFRYPILASAYAGLAGFDLPDIILQSQDLKTGNVEAMDKFIPARDGTNDAEFDNSLTNLTKARDIVFSLPAEERIGSSDKYYASSAEIQLQLYQMFLTQMNMSKYMIKGEDGKLKSDPSALANMSDEDAEQFFKELANGAEIASLGESFKDLSGNIQEQFLKTQGDINTQEGESSSEKLSAYINSLNE